jgi:UDP-N-acetylglucosamine 1-carboxyvinyltransferase
MSNYVINGGKKLKGAVATKSAKNAAVAILCATALIRGKTTLVDVPEIEEVKRIMEILNSIGIKTFWSGKNKLTIENQNHIDLKNIDRKATKLTRSSFLIVGALANKLKKFTLYKPGGCELGIRTLNPHILAFAHLGIKIKESKKEITVDATRAHAADFTMYEMSDMGTENAILAAVLLQGKTIIRFPSSNYMTQDLCYFLNQAGANIKGIGTEVLEITGVTALKPVADYPIMPDPIESMAFIAIAIATASALTIQNCPVDFLRIELEKLRVMGQKFQLIKQYQSKNTKFALADILIKPSKLTAPPDKIHAQPYPGINIDNLHFFVPILNCAKGKTIIHDWVYENRAIYATELSKLGARVELLDPHRLVVEGPTTLKGAEIICPPALRPAMNILICMLAAKGKSILRNLYSINRGYESIIERLKDLGADITEIT